MFLFYLMKTLPFSPSINASTQRAKYPNSSHREQFLMKQHAPFFSKRNEKRGILDLLLPRCFWSSPQPLYGSATGQLERSPNALETKQLVDWGEKTYEGNKVIIMKEQLHFFFSPLGFSGMGRPRAALTPAGTINLLIYLRQGNTCEKPHKKA